MKKLILFIILAVLAATAYFISTGHYSSGDRAGTISKLSEKGYVFKTNEGELNEGGFSGETGAMTPRIWPFSTTEDSVVVKLKSALATGERVTLHYQEKFMQFPWNGDTKYFIVDVTFLPSKVLPPPPPVEAPPAETVIDTTKK